MFPIIHIHQIHSFRTGFNWVVIAVAVVVVVVVAKRDSSVKSVVVPPSSKHHHMSSPVLYCTTGNVAVPTILQRMMLPVLFLRVSE